MTTSTQTPSRPANTYGVTQKHIDMLTEVFANIPSLCQVWLFGSRARGDYKLKSDFDLLILTTDTSETKHPTINELDYAIDQSDFWYSVDIKELSQITDPIFAKEIARDKILLWKRP